MREKKIKLNKLQYQIKQLMLQWKLKNKKKVIYMIIQNLSSET